MATKHPPHLRLSPEQNLFHSPGLSATSIESGNTSEQDEFHLERYSEGLKWDKERRAPGQQKPARQLSTRAREPSPRKRPRPGLNIITDFSEPVRRAFTHGVVLDKVKTQYPEVGQKPIPTARSQTVEHVRAEPQRPQEGSGFVNLDDLVDLRKREKKQKSPSKTGKKSRLSGILSNAKEKPPPAYSGGNPYYNAHTKSIRPNRAYMRLDEAAPNYDLNRHNQQPASPSNSSIVIGISIPEHDVDSHKPPPGASSALTLTTPFTPTIVVTPAEAAAPWGAQKDASDGNHRRKPASSIYSQATPYVAPLITSTDTPPVPSVPQGFTNNRGAERRSVDSWDTIATRRQRIYSAATIFDEDEDEVTGRPRSVSAESNLAILPSSVDTARPQSKGWWNLMMSPMLSRAGTLMNRKSPPVKQPMPPMPVFSAAQEKSDQLDELNEKSAPLVESQIPPHEVGLDTKRASTWSQWSSWEKERERLQDQEKIAEVAKVDSTKGHNVQDSSVTVEFMMNPSPVAKGLAAEYYHACAVDMRSTTPYFECQNHSCAEQLPKIASISVSTGGGKDRGLTQQSASSSPRALSDKHVRSDSDSTVIEDEPAEILPVTREAEVVPVSKARTISKPAAANTDDPAGSSPDDAQSEVVEPLPIPEKSVTPPEYSSPRPAKARLPNRVATAAAAAAAAESRLPPSSPGPISPEMQRAMTSQGAIPMAEIQHAPSRPTFINHYTIYPEPPSRPNVAPVVLADINPPQKAREKAEAKRQRLEKEDEVARKVGGFWRGRGKNGCFGRGGPEGRKRRRWYIALAAGLFLIVIVSIVLATQLTRKGDKTPVQSQWLNLTGFPPMPTGISTIVRPDAAVEDSDCVDMETIWSCAVPKEDQASIAPNDPDQPNFRIEITFRNGTVPANETTSTASKRWFDNSFGILGKRQNDPFTNALFAPNPAAPPTAEQIFLGNTTDNITFPFNGEATPFFITFIPTSPVLPSAFNTTSTTSSRLRGRQTSNSSNDLTSDVPPPDIGSDGTAAPANLLPNDPLPYSQPVQLYNRGQSTEHYGFYTYFDRAIFLTNTTPVADGETGPSEDQNGGSTKEEANWRCTFSQTRFLVRIWTNAGFGATLLDGGPTAFPSLDGESTTTTNANSTATDFTPPGSFPYPVSITLDRHGGDMDKKGAFCYKMDPSGDGTIVVDDTSPQVLSENREAGGILINPAPSKLTLPDGGDADGTFDPNAGGIDGGTGGCRCEWRNWLGDVSGNV